MHGSNITRRRVPVREHSTLRVGPAWSSRSWLCLTLEEAAMMSCSHVADNVQLTMYEKALPVASLEQQALNSDDTCLFRKVTDSHQVHLRRTLLLCMNNDSQRAYKLTNDVSSPEHMRLRSGVRTSDGGRQGRVRRRCHQPSMATSNFCPAPLQLFGSHALTKSVFGFRPLMSC